MFSLDRACLRREEDGEAEVHACVKFTVNVLFITFGAKCYENNVHRHRRLVSACPSGGVFKGTGHHSAASTWSRRVVDHICRHWHASGINLHCATLASPDSPNAVRIVSSMGPAPPSAQYGRRDNGVHARETLWHIVSSFVAHSSRGTRNSWHLVWCEIGMMTCHPDDIAPI